MIRKIVSPISAGIFQSSRTRYRMAVKLAAVRTTEKSVSAVILRSDLY